MNSLSIGGPRHVGPIVYDQTATGVAKEFPQFYASLVELPGGGVFVAELY
jgi:hypothetical protein